MRHFEMETRMHFNNAFSSEDSFTITCGRTGVGSITAIELFVNSRFDWGVEWVRINDGIESFRIWCNYNIPGYESRRFDR